MAPKKGEKSEIQRGLLPLTGNQQSSLCAALQSEDEDRLGVGSLIFQYSAVKFLSCLWIPNHPDPTEPSCGPVQLLKAITLLMRLHFPWENPVAPSIWWGTI